MNSQPRIERIQFNHNPAQWMHLLDHTPLPLATCSQRSSFTMITFFLLILFEILKMSPTFVIYINSALSAILPFTNGNFFFTWLNRYFLPRMEITSFIINIQSQIGLLLILFGFSFLCISTAKRYSQRPTKKDAFSGGIYNYIRHPHYTSLALCGFGMLLLWPSYLVLSMYIAMVFGCYFLCRIKEHEFKLKFGQSYIEYKKRTGMFLPIHIPFIHLLPRLPRYGLRRLAVILGIYILTTLAAIGLTKLV